ncbi:33711_t:CDS:10 [Gigaspora margarita]|uniref:33711_t:CDS:1 n=1 Tax=Gigaspora margarita TaxID=4874 RepID=A0ABM8W1E6_GIGMA|nr:33711_t:CDS:10 [Gigaspora margarita]
MHEREQEITSLTTTLTTKLIKIRLNVPFEIPNYNITENLNTSNQIETSSINQIDIQISKGHWSATCNGCNEFWYKGSSAVLEDHLDNLYKKVPPDLQISDFIESTKLTPERIKDISRALLKAFIVCEIPFHIIENPFFIELLKTLRSAYELPSKDVFSSRYLAQETAFVYQATIKQLNDSENLTIACDGWSNPSNESIWNFIIYTPGRNQYLCSLQNLSNERHMQELLADEIINILEKISPEKFSAIVTDSGANVKAACHIVTKQYSNILNIRCISYAINLISKDISRTSFTDHMLKRCKTLVRSTLKTLAEENLIEGGGLKQWVDTHWHTMYDYCSLADCFISLVRLGAAIKRLPENDYHNFRQQAIAIFNRRFAEFDDDAYILCFYLHPGYTIWAQGTFRHILLAADNFYTKMNKIPKERKMLMAQMRNHICQLANKLFSITPHAAGCKRIWSTLGWYYGKCRTWLSLGKIENIQKLSAFYLANSKKELPHFSANKGVEDLYEALSNVNLIQDIELLEEELLTVEELLNLDTPDFTNDLGEVILDTGFKSSEKKNGNVQNHNTKNDTYEENWDPEKEINEMLD